MVNKKLAEKLGPETVVKLIELFIEEMPLRDVVTELPEANLSVDSLVKLRREHLLEIEAIESSYRSQFPYGRPERLKVLIERIAADVRVEETPEFSVDEMVEEKRTIAAGLVSLMSYDDIAEKSALPRRTIVDLVRKDGDIAEFLIRAGYTPKIARLTKKWYLASGKR